jgi:hypothetical protein
MWLIMMGQRRSELRITEGYQAYRQRYNIEHLLRFGKQRLLLNASGTPQVEHEENWVQHQVIKKEKKPKPTPPIAV